MMKASVQKECRGKPENECATKFESWQYASSYGQSKAGRNIIYVMHRRVGAEIYKCVEFGIYSNW
jgi:hypothetical protein